MIIKNIKIIQSNNIIENGYIEFDNSKIISINSGICGDINALDGKGNILMPGFIDVHIHGSCGIDFMDASVSDYKTISSALLKEGVTSYLATTLTSDKESLKKVCERVKEAKKDNPSLLGIHFEGPYISVKYKGAQNEAYIRNPNIEEFDYLNECSGNNIKYISLAPELNGSLEFIKHVTFKGVTVSAGHTNASFDDIKNAIDAGLSNTTHTHNAMSPHHHRNPGVVTAAMYFDKLFTEVIVDRIHVVDNTLKTFYKIVGPDRFMIITDALKAKHSDLNTFKLFGLDCEKKNGAAYLLSGPLAGSLLSFDQGVRNMYELVNPSLSDLLKISSLNAAKSLHLKDRGDIQIGMIPDFVLLDNKLNVIDVYKLGKKVN